MINTIHAHVIGASRYSMDNGVKGAKITIMQPSATDNENQIGYQVSTMSAPYEILDQLHAHAVHMPCNMELDIEFRSSGGKATLHVLAVRKPNATGSAQPAAATSSDKK
ncbi:hypothetical protein [Vreelandella nigrificans]|uniref:Uncharacterized protein n=1 Tax=Vreelandella nigrificans TaxID=2042704 RepID=A0A2A4HRQ0_9GAMM|nr:hypothetical protein [Halomonas nigrificans]PCF96915.1 hypothetical protein CPA45_04185 [Halomonas nigrificans]